MNKNDTPYIIEIDGRRFEISPQSVATVDCHPLGNNLFQLYSHNEHHQVKVIQFDLITGKCILEIDGKTRHVKLLREIDVRIEKMGLNKVHQKKQSVLSAPMPGLVTAVKVSPGDHVEMGTPLIILEAMKMENVITAPHDAVVKQILVQIGQPVERGLSLIEFASDQHK